MLMVCLLCARYARADYFVTFHDGSLSVFPSACLQEMTDDGATVEFTALDGKPYAYPKSSILTIDTLLTKQLPVMTSFEFRKKQNYQLVQDEVGIIGDDVVNVTVAGIGKWLTASFTLSDDHARALVDGKVQVSGESRLHHDESRIYTVCYPRDLILKESQPGCYEMLPYGHEYAVDVNFLADHSTAVPRIDINTVGGEEITSRENYLDAEIIIDGAGVFPSMTDSVRIRGRGNTSWSNKPGAKNSYRLKFAEKVKPLGLTKGRNWVLLANKMKASMLSNALGMKASSLIGTAAVNHIIPVDLYLNGTYRGSYNLSEKVGLSNNSVDVADETVAALLELDKYYDEPEGQKFLSATRDLPVNIKKPDFDEGGTLLTLADIKRRFDAFAATVMNGGNLAAHADIDNLARYLLATNLLCNKELFHPKSVFCYYEDVLDEDSKLVFGPMWDLDWACGYFYFPENTYFEVLVDYDFFNSNYKADQYPFMSALGHKRLVSKRMLELCRNFIDHGLDELCDYCGEYYQYAQPSLDMNRVTLFDGTNYAAQARNAASWFRSRANIILERLVVENVTRWDVNGDGEVTVNDVNALISAIQEGADSSPDWPRADVNGDGEVTIGDVNLLTDFILGGN